MRNYIFGLGVAIISALSLQGCHPGGSLVSHERDAEFYNQFVNPSSEMPTAEARIGELKLLQTFEIYEMRFALFDNGKAYYQIDTLGNGEGHWKYNEGAITVTAVRPIFNMNITFSGAQAEGNETVARFIDRFGYNQVPVVFREPAALRSKANKLAPLRAFTASDKNI